MQTDPGVQTPLLQVPWLVRRWHTSGRQAPPAPPTHSRPAAQQKPFVHRLPEHCASLVQAEPQAGDPVAAVLPRHLPQVPSGRRTRCT
jgi:hypothetical protein